MAGIQGLVGLIPPAGKDPAGERPEKRNNVQADAPRSDKVTISLEAKGAAGAARLAASAGEEVRNQAVEQARRNIEEGVYNLQSVVQLVAARVSPYLR